MAASNKTNLDIRLFYGGGRGDGWATRMIKSLEVDNPVAVSDYAPSTTQPQSAVSSISQAAKRLGIRVATRTIEGQLYVMRLREDPAQAPAA